MKKAPCISILFVWIFLVGLKPVEPTDVLSSDEIQEIVATKDFFEYKEMESNIFPMWKTTERKYSAQFLRSRPDYLSMDDVIHHILTDGFPIQYKLQELCRANLGIHTAIGNIVPKVKIAIGQGAGPIDISTLFSGLFGFLLPSNWLQLSTNIKAYDVAEKLLLKIVLDEILNAKIAYINQHKLLTDLEILNFHFIHTAIFSTMFSHDSPSLSLIKGARGNLSVTMALKEADVRTGFDTLADEIGLEKIKSKYTTQHFNIRQIEDFKFEVQDFSLLEKLHYETPEAFLQEVIRRSIELKAAKKLYEIGKLNIGITATGGTLGTIDNTTRADFAITLGYGNIPNVLSTNSSTNTAFIDVKSQYVDILNSARVAYDLYKNSMHVYTQATVSLKENRKAFVEIMKETLEKSLDPDLRALFPMQNMITAELQLNLALHNAMIAEAYMDRFLLVEEQNAVKYLPAKGDVMKLFKELTTKIGGTRLDPLGEEFSQIHSRRKLDAILHHHTKNHDWSHYTEEEIKKGVTENINSLLYSKNFSLYKSKKFYRVLDNYIREKRIELTQEERFTLQQKQLPWYRFLRKKGLEKEDLLHNFEFEELEIQPEFGVIPYE